MKKTLISFTLFALLLVALLIFNNSEDEATTHQREDSNPQLVQLLDGEPPLERASIVTNTPEKISDTEEFQEEPSQSTEAYPPSLHPDSVHYPIADLKELERRDRSSADGSLERTRILIDSSNRYPYIRVVEQLRIDTEGNEVLLGFDAMVGDHILVETSVAQLIEEQEILAGTGLSIRRKLPHSPLFLIETDGHSLDAVPDAINALSSLIEQGVAIEPDYLAFPTVIPNDDRWSSMYGMLQIDAPTAWDITTGSEDVIVAILDTGTQVEHPDLAANVWINKNEIPNNGIDDDGNGYIDDINGWNVNDDNNDLSDVDGHGSHVGGTMAAVGNNEIGVTGVAWNQKLMVFAGGDTFSTSETIEMLDYCVYMKTQHGYNVVSTNHSYGALRTNSTYTGSSSRRSAIARARDADILFVAAAGNDGRILEGTSDLDGNGTFYNHFPSSQSVENYPASGDWDSVISVAASRDGDGKASFTNRGSDLASAADRVVDLAAPGNGIQSLNRSSGYRNLSGTSMASPHIAGAAGLIAAANTSLSGDQIRQIIFDTIDNTSDFQNHTTTGGRMNLGAAVTEAASYPQVEIVNMSGEFFLPAGSDIALIAEAFDGDGTVTSVSFYTTDSQTPLHTDTNGTDGWSYNWTNVAVGQHQIYVSATDNDGKTVYRKYPRLIIHSGAVIIDSENAKIETNGFFRSISSFYTGIWGSSVYANTFAGAGEYLDFFFELPISGPWDVYLYWPDGASSNSQMPLTLSHDSGSIIESVRIDQNDQQFHLIGSGTFTANTEYTLEVDGENFTGTRALVDAMRLVYRGNTSTPFLSLSSSGKINENSSESAAFYLNRNDSSGSLTVNFTVSGSAASGIDYGALPTSVTFADGELTKVISVSLINDQDVEPDEDIVLTIVSSANYAVAGTDHVTIEIISEDRVGVVNLNRIDETQNESVGTLTYEVSRTEGSSGAVSVDIAAVSGTATSGSDFAALSQTLNWGHLESDTKTINVSIIDDSEVEPTESFTLSLQNATGGLGLGSATTSTITITDNEVNPASTVVITSPSDGGTFTSAEQITVTVDASDPQGVSNVELLMDGTVVGEDATAPYEFTFNGAWNTSATFVARVTDSATATTDSASIQLNFVSGALPSVWNGVDVGTMSIPGEASYAAVNQTFSLRSVGSRVDNNFGGEDLHFVQQTALGDATLIARFESISASNNNAFGGIMFRSSASSDAETFILGKTRGKAPNYNWADRIIYRTSSGTNAVQQKGTNRVLPLWLKIERVGNDFTGFTSTDGSSWTQIGDTQTIDMGATVEAGLVLSGIASVPAIASFDNVSLTTGTPPPPNAAPVASFTPDKTSGDAPLLVNFDGTASSDADSDPLTYFWDFDDGNGFVSGTSTENFTFTSAGTYTVKLKVNDGTEDSIKVSETITVTTDSNPPGNTVPVASFTISTNSGSAPLTVDFDASASSDADNDTLSYFWNFDNGNGFVPGTVNESFTFNTAGTFTVRLKVNDGTEDSIEVTETISVTTPGSGGSIIVDVDTIYLNLGPISLGSDTYLEIDLDDYTYAGASATDIIDYTNFTSTDILLSVNQTGGQSRFWIKEGNQWYRANKAKSNAGTKSYTFGSDITAFEPYTGLGGSSTGGASKTLSDFTSISAFGVYLRGGSTYNNITINATVTTAGLPVIPPLAPSNLLATTISSTNINLAWTDNSENENGFKVFRSMQSNSGFTLLTTVGANVTTYTDSSLLAATTYYYQVIATNGDGDSAATTGSATTRTEQQQFFADSGLPYDVNPTVDSDGDGFTNEEEERAGTNPNNASDLFKLDMATDSGTGDMALTAPTIAGRYYRLSWRPSLGDGDWQTVAGHKGTTPSDGSDINLPITPSGSGFYRMEVSHTAWPE